MPAAASSAAGRRPRLRTVLLAVNLLILLLPVGGIATLRLYENELIRGTEAQLLAQGAIVREAFRQELERIGDVAPTPGAAPQAVDEGNVRALTPRLDVAREAILPPAPAARPPGGAPGAAAAAAGARVEPLLRSAARETLSGMRIVDPSGIVVATSGSESGLSLADREEVVAALAGRSVSVLRRRVSDNPSPPLESISRGQRYRVFVGLPVLVDGRVAGAVVLSRTPLDISKALYLNRTPLLLGAAALLAVVLAVTLLTSTLIARPLRALAARADRAAAGGPAALSEISDPGVDEIARLSRALADMARALELRAEYIRTFASHVSHEFKTPLAAIRGAIELLQDDRDGMTEPERARFLSRIEEASSRLDLLVSRLLELARADVLRPGGASCDLGSVASAVAERFRAQGLDVRAEPGRAGVVARIAPDVFEQVLASLLDNARVHGGSSVAVRVEVRAGAGEALVAVSDDGPGVSEANAARVFTPFFTTARERGGSGLGLAIARSLIEAHDGTLALRRPGPGAVFEIRLPLSGEGPGGPGATTGS